MIDYSACFVFLLQIAALSAVAFGAYRVLSVAIPAAFGALCQAVSALCDFVVKLAMGALYLFMLLAPWVIFIAAFMWAINYIF